MATKRQVEDKLRELIRRLATADAGVHRSLRTAVPEPRVVEVVLRDLDATYWTKLSDGSFGTLRKGSPDHADITLTTTSDQLVELVDGRASLMSSYLSGRVKVDGSVGDLMRLRRLG